ncbi:MAG: hypothetical protein EOP09_17195 [Proteobacteria bacterium]|nr:MAG: hypothetical protein EOP09_17195 [Pseudomonadota bacterium]
MQFGGADELVEAVLRARLERTEDDRSKRVSLSLQALSKRADDAPVLSILVIGRMLNNQIWDIDGNLLAKAYAQSALLETESTTNDFIRILGERVADAALGLNATNHASDYSVIRRFLSRLDRRVVQLSTAIFWLLLLIAVILWIYVVILYFSPEKKEEELAGKLFQAGLVVFPLGLWLAKKRIIGILIRSLYRSVGGSELLEKAP